MRKKKTESAMRHRLPVPRVVLSVLMAGLFHSIGRAQAPTNLVRNSDFERAFSDHADGWRVQPMPAGARNERRESAGLDGGPCHAIDAPAGLPVTWYQCSQTVAGAAPGGQYVLSASLRTENVRDGAGAYMGMNYYDSEGTRITWTDSEQRLTGTTAWTRIVQPFSVPTTATRVDVTLVLHGHGSAFFDRVQVEPGEVATDWESREASMSAGELPDDLDLTPSPAGNVAILRDSLPVTGTASDPQHLRTLVEQAGYGCAFLDAEALADSELLNYAWFDAAVLPYGASFPAAAADSLLAFCRDGGSLFAFGGYPFDRLLARKGDEWVDVGELTPDESKLTVLFDLADGPAGWGAGGRGVLDGPASSGEGRGGQSLRLATESLSGWVTVSSPVVEGLPQGSQLTAFWARADQDDVVMTMEWGEVDQSRWRARFALTREWKLYAVGHAELEYWHDNPSEGRGGPEDNFRPADAAQIRFGLTAEFLQEGLSYGVDVDSVMVGDTPLPAYRHPQLNSHQGASNPATFLEPPPTAISICDASALLEDVSVLAPSAGQTLLPSGWRAEADVHGFSATGQTAQGHAGAPLKARWVPVVDALDRYGRIRGTALALMHNFAGEYPGSTWAYSGISDHDLFAPGDRAGATLFRATLDRIMQGGFLFDGRAEPRSARRGETARLRVRAANLARADRDLTVRLEVRSGDRVLLRKTDAARVAARSATAIDIGWTVPADTGGLVELQWELLNGRQVLDRLDVGMVVWSAEQLAAGPKLSYDDCYFARDRGPEFMLGSQIYWGNVTATGTDPLRWDRQLAEMADSGIKIARSFMSMTRGTEVESEAVWRQRDAMVQLAQARGISLFYSGVSWPSTDPAEVAERARVANHASERYRGSAAWFIDIVNEPNMPVGGGETDAGEFRAHLRDKYKTFEALRDAWGTELTEGSFDEVEIAPATGDWSSIRAVDVNRFMAHEMRVWTDETAKAAHAADPGRLVSVGHLQGFGDSHTMWDPIEASYDMDFTNRHFYGDPWRYGPELKQIDMRVLGKAPSTGEFGNTSHPGLKSHWVYAPEEVVDWHYAYTVHTCFGLGGAFCANWHWQDPIEDIFPCGLLLQDGTPRPRFQTYRNLGLLFRGIRPRYEPPELFFVIPTSHRFGASKADVEAAMNRCLAALISLHVEFGTVAEENLAALPPSAKALVWPVPFCPADETVDSVLQFVREGGSLYLSGDVSYDPLRRRTRTQRLVDLCGVEFVEERYNAIRSADAPVAELRPAEGSSLGEAASVDDASRPCIQVRPVSADVVAWAGDAPAATLAQVGGGRVLYVADPVELRGEPRHILGAFLREAGVARHRLVPDSAEIHSHRVPGEGGAVAHVLFNLSDAKARVEVLDLPVPIEFELAPKSGGAAIFSGEGRLTAVEGLAARADGVDLLKADSTASLISLSGADLRRGGPLLLLPSRPGVVELSGDGRGDLWAGCGEVRDGRWVEHERMELRDAGGRRRITLDAAMARSWIVIGDEGRLRTLGDRACREHL